MTVVGKHAGTGRLLIALLGFFACLAFPLSSADASTGNGAAPLWSDKEVKRTSLKRFKLWIKALERIEKENAEAPAECPDSLTSRYVLCHWYDYVETLRDKPKEDQIRAINRKANQRRYVLDPINWNVDDYWESPGQFIQKQGDCEDYAIVKYMALRKLGFPVENLRIVVVRDMNLGGFHAVLAIYDGAEILILDNQVKKIVKAERIAHYRALYSLNEVNWWQHNK